MLESTKTTTFCKLKQNIQPNKMEAGEPRMKHFQHTTKVAFSDNKAIKK